MGSVHIESAGSVLACSIHVMENSERTRSVKDARLSVSFFVIRSELIVILIGSRDVGVVFLNML